MFLIQSVGNAESVDLPGTSETIAPPPVRLHRPRHHEPDGWAGPRHDNGKSVQSVGDERYQVLKEIPTKNRLTLIDDVGGKRYLVEEAMPTIEWTLTEGNSTIAQYMPEGHRQVARQDVDGAPHG